MRNLSAQTLHDEFFSVKKNYFNSLEFILCQSIIFLNAGVLEDNEQTLDKMIYRLEYSRDDYKHLLSLIPTDHPAVTFFDKLSFLDDSTYDIVRKDLIKKIKNHFSSFRDNFFLALSLEEEAELLSSFLVDVPSNVTINEYIEKLLDEENSSALAITGYAYLNEKDIEKDVDKGLEYLKNSAKKNNLSALYNLYNHYRLDDKDDNKAKRYAEKFVKVYEKSSEYKWEYVNVLKFLADLYFSEHDYQKAYTYYFKSYQLCSDRNSETKKQVMEKLFDMSFAGLGTEQDIDSAYSLILEYDKKFDSSYSKAIALLMNLLENRSDYSKEEIYKLAKSDELQGSILSSFILGYMYEKGIATSQNFENAIKYYSISSKNEFFIADLFLANLYFHGLGVPRNDENAINYLKKFFDGSSIYDSEEDEFCDHQIEKYILKHTFNSDNIAKDVATCIIKDAALNLDSECARIAIKNFNL